MNKNTVNVLDNIGNTPLVKATSLGRFLGIENLYLKIESYNPTGTYKDRATKKVLEDAINSKAKGITIATCGNFGFSIATFCKESALPCNIFIPRRYSTDKGEKIERLGAIVTYTEGSYEDAVDTSVQYALDCGFYNANPSCPHSADLAMEGYAFMSNEIIEQLRGNPIGSVWSAVGNGTGLAGMYKGFKRIIKDLPSFGAVSSLDNNPIIESFNLDKELELDPNDLRETHINEPLVNFRSYQLKTVLKALSGNGMVYGATDEEMVNANQLLKNFEGIDSSPASASVLSGIMSHRESLDMNKAHVLILTS